MKKIVILTAIIACCVCKFDPELAQDLFQLNVATYCRPSHVRDWSCKPCQTTKIQLK
jgi:hypothetical protein